MQSAEWSWWSEGVGVVAVVELECRWRRDLVERDDLRVAQLFEDGDLPVGALETRAVHPALLHHLQRHLHTHTFTCGYC